MSYDGAGGLIVCMALVGCPLSVDQLAVVGLIGNGLSGRQIAVARGVSVAAVQRLVEGAEAVADVHGRVRLVLRAERAGWTSAPHPPSAPCPLNAFEMAVARLICEGLTAREIAARRGALLTTVRGQIHSARARLGVRSQPQLALVMERSGWLAVEVPGELLAPRPAAAYRSETTLAQRAYLAAFERFLRSRSDSDRFLMTVALDAMRAERATLGPAPQNHSAAAAAWRLAHPRPRPAGAPGFPEGGELVGDRPVCGLEDVET